MRLKKTLLVLLMISLVFVAACSTANNENNSMNNSDAENNADEIKDEDPVEDEFAEQLSLSFFFPGEADTVMPRGDADFVRKAIEEKFNVKIDMQTMPIGSDFTTRLNLLISSGDTPDLMITSGTLAAQLNQSGVMADLEAYLNPEVMPNLFEWVSPETVEIFQLPGLYTRGPVPVYPRRLDSYFIRKDWLDKVGLDYPTNYEELTNVMRAFTEEDPNGNNRNDTYGFSAPGNGSTVSWMFPQYRNYGFAALMTVDPDTREFLTSFAHPDVAHAIDDIRDWLDAGYVDPDWYLNRVADVAQKFAQGRIGMVWGAASDWALDSNPNSYFNQLKQLYPDAEVMPFHPFPGEPVSIGTSPSTTWSISERTAQESPEKVERIIKIVEWLLGEEGFLLTQYGLEDQHYTRDGNTIHFMPEVFEEEIVNRGNFLATWSQMTPRYPENLGLEFVDPNMTDRDLEILDIITGYPLGQGLGTSVTPPEGFDWGAFTSKRSEIQVQYLYEKDRNPDWNVLLQEFLTKYGGNELFRSYTEQAEAVGVEIQLWDTDNWDWDPPAIN